MWHRQAEIYGRASWEGMEDRELLRRGSKWRGFNTLRVKALLPASLKKEITSWYERGDEQIVHRPSLLVHLQTGSGVLEAGRRAVKCGNQNCAGRSDTAVPAVQVMPLTPRPSASSPSRPQQSAGHLAESSGVSSACGVRKAKPTSSTNVQNSSSLLPALFLVNKLLLTQTDSLHIS